MPKFQVTRCSLVWEVNTVEAEDAEAAYEKADNEGEWKIIDTDYRGSEIEEI